MSVDAQFGARLASSKLDVDALVAQLHAQPQGAFVPHLRVLAVHANLILEAAQAAPTLPERMRAAVRVEQLLRLAFELRAQHTLENARVLLLASYAASECYQYVMQAAWSLGAKPADRWPEPAVLLEPMASPVTFVRGSAAQFLGFMPGTQSRLPFPLVLMPRYPISAVASLCLIHHEIGHNIDADLGLSDALRPELEARLEAAQTPPQLIDTWLEWLEEVVADAFGTLLAGQAYAFEMAGWAAALGDDVGLSSRTHPYPSLRVALSRRLLALVLGPSRGSLGSASGVPESKAISDRFGQQVPLVARALFEAPLGPLGGASLADLAPAVARDDRAVELGAAALARGIGLGLKELPLRLFPAAACVAVNVHGASAEAVGEELFAIASHPSRGHTAVPFSEDRYRETTLRDAVAPLLDEERDGLKLPPPGLFARVRRVSFVGATNEGLPKLFGNYLSSDSGGTRKARLEVFFLGAETLEKLAGGGRDTRDVLQEGRMARDALTPALLDQVAEEWALYEHDEPYFFASYWDAEGPGGRIHVSAHGWGQDIKRAPSHDYTWPLSAASPERSYRFYRDSLSALRARARRFA